VSYEFEWDPAKADENLRKHGVGFEEAVTVFADSLALNMPDPSHSAEEEEERYLVLGSSKRARLLVVAYAERNTRTRIMSARKATRRERHDYEEGQE
jgi:hypothetical protein